MLYQQQQQQKGKKTAIVVKTSSTNNMRGEIEGESDIIFNPPLPLWRWFDPLLPGGG